MRAVANHTPHHPNFPTSVDLKYQNKTITKYLSRLCPISETDNLSVILSITLIQSQPTVTIPTSYELRFQFPSSRPALAKEAQLFAWSLPFTSYQNNRFPEAWEGTGCRTQKPHFAAAEWMAFHIGMMGRCNPSQRDHAMEFRA